MIPMDTNYISINVLSLESVLWRLKKVVSGVLHSQELHEAQQIRGVVFDCPALQIT